MRALQLDRPAPAGAQFPSGKPRATGDASEHFRSGGPLRPVELPDPVPAQDELVLAVAACAVCRTDLQLCEGQLDLRRRPLVPGHQAVGRVVALGSAVRGWELGDRAGVGWLGGACGVCDRCRGERENLCDRAVFTGWDRDGGFAERICLRADFALRLPPAFSDLAAAPLLCGGVIGYRSLQVAGARPGTRLGLFGFGASALVTLQVARHRGCDVYVCTRSAQDRARAAALGAVWTGSYEERPPVPLDAAISFAPSGDVVVRALAALDKGATLAINAIHLDRVPQFPYELLWGERRLASVANYTRADAAAFLALAGEIPISTAVEAHPLEDANVALARLASGAVEGAAVLTL